MLKVVCCIFACAVVVNFSAAFAAPFKVRSSDGTLKGEYANANEAALAVENNGTVEICEDATFAGELFFGGRTGVRLKSTDGATYTLKRADTTGRITVSNNAASAYGNVKSSLTFTNIVLDGGAVWKYPDDLSNVEVEEGAVGEAATFLRIGRNPSTGSTCEMRAGTVIQNVFSSIALHPDTLGELKMYPGSVVRDCRADQIVALGWQTGTFTMEGGLITNCCSLGRVRTGGLVQTISDSGIFNLKGGTIMGNCGKDAGVIYMPVNFFRLYLGGGLEPLVVKENYLLNGTTHADIFITSNYAQYLSGKLSEGSEVYLRYSDTAAPAVMEGTQFGVVSYFAKDTSARALNYQFNPVGGTNYLGRVYGDRLVWADESIDYEIKQGQVFEVSNDGGVSWTAYSLLEDAYAAVASGGVIEVVTNALYDRSISFTSKSWTLRSRAPDRFVLKRAAAAVLKLQGYLTITNLVIDGGAVWSNPGTLTDATCTGVVGGKFCDIPVTQGLLAYLYLKDGCEIRNFNPSPTMIYINSGGHVLLYNGASIHDCRGGNTVTIGYDRATFQFEGGAFYSNSGSGNFVDAYNGGYLGINSGFITNNISNSGAVSATGNYKVYIGGGFDQSSLWYTVLWHTVPAGTMIIKDNWSDAGRTVPANVTLKAATSLQQRSPLNADSEIHVKIPTSGSSVLGDMIGSVISEAAASAAPHAHTVVNDMNPLWRAALSPSGTTTNLIWAQRIILGTTVAYADAAELDGALDIIKGGLDDLDKEIGAGEGYPLIYGTMGITGAFDSFTLDDAFGLSESQTAMWRLKYCKSGGIVTDVSLIYVRSGMRLLIK